MKNDYGWKEYEFDNTFETDIELNKFISEFEREHPTEFITMKHTENGDNGEVILKCIITVPKLS